MEDESGKSVRLGDLITGPTIILPVYYACTNVCNYMQGGLARVIKELKRKPGIDYRVISISFNHEETPEQSERTRKMYLAAINAPFPEEGWRFLTGDRDNIHRFTESIGYRFKQQGRDFIHPVASLIVSGDGKIVRYLYGTSFLAKDLSLAFLEARDGKVGNTIRKVVDFCFTFDPTGKYCEGSPEAVPGEYVHLSVSDDGCGMDKETMTRVFEPFFTTKAIGEGTGLGLSTVYGIVKQNNGFINIYSEPGKGTTFTIHLPRQVEMNKKSLTEAKTVPLPKGQETILLVEDEPDILFVTAKLLGKQGYTLLTAGTPGEAVRLAHEHSGEIDLLITDVIMPEMNGKDLADKLQSQNPQLKCLYMSGYTADIIAHHGVLDEGVHFIQKPFSLPDLAIKVRDLLDC